MPPPDADSPFRVVFDAAANPLLLLRRDGHLVAANSAAAALLRAEDGAIEDLPLAAIATAHGAELAAVWEALLSDGRGSLDLRSGDGDCVTVSIELAGAIAEDLHLAVVEDGTRAASGPRLTPRQRDTIRLLCDGATNTQIALALGVSEPTVQKHIAAAKERLGAATRAQIVALALEHDELARRVSRERLSVHQAIRDGDGAIVDTRLVYVGTVTRRRRPEIAPHVGRAMSEWYPDYATSDLLRLIARAIQTSERQEAEDLTLHPPWRPGGYRVSASAAPIGQERAIFVTRSHLSGPAR